jgi:hypothetical protein
VTGKNNQRTEVGHDGDASVSEQRRLVAPELDGAIVLPPAAAHVLQQVAPGAERALPVQLHHHVAHGHGVLEQQTVAGGVEVARRLCFPQIDRRVGSGL